MRLFTTLIGVMVLGSTSCRCPSRGAPPDLEASPPSELCGDPSLDDEDFCLPAQRLEKLLREGSFKILDSHLTAQGTSAPQRLRLAFERPNDEPLVIFAKWKQAPLEGEESNNSPRREIAAYELQKLLFAAHDHVVPPTALRCLSLAEHGERLPEATAYPGTRCSLGMLAYWLENVRELEGIDRGRFAEERQYRRHLSALNIFTYVAAHRDSVGLNFLLSTDDDAPRVFSVDNGMTFGAFKYNPLSWFSNDWLEIQVPSLSQELIDGLERVAPSDLEELSVVAELELRDGLYFPVAHGEPLDPTVGIRRRGDRFQLGLTADEIAEVFARKKELVASVRKGEVALHDVEP